jgi:hypothetical protein
MNKYLPFVFLVLLVMQGCNRNELNISDYMNYYSKEKSFEAKLNVDSCELQARVVPKEFISIAEIGSSAVNLPASYLDSVIEMTENFTYVFFDYKNKFALVDALMWNCGDSIDIDSRINYLNQDFQKSVFLVSGQDTINCAITQLERTYKLTDRTRILLGFSYDFNNLRSPLKLILNRYNQLTFKSETLDFFQFDKTRIKKLSL